MLQNIQLHILLSFTEIKVIKLNIHSLNDEECKCDYKHIPVTN